jgi:hypothetical protein
MSGDEVQGSKSIDLRRQPVLGLVEWDAVGDQIMDTDSANTAPASTTDDNAIALLLNANRDEILRLAGQHGAGNVRLFGSAVRGEATAASDLDILVDFESGRLPPGRGALVDASTVRREYHDRNLAALPLIG